MPDRDPTEKISARRESAKRRTDRWLASELRDAQRESLQMILDKEREERDHELELEKIKSKRMRGVTLAVVILGAIALAGGLGIPVGLEWAGIGLKAGGQTVEQAQDGPSEQ